MLKEFKEFVMRGNVVDMAVGVVIGAAFGAIVKSLVADLLMPPIGVLMGGVDFANLFFILKAGATAGPVTVNYGIFVNAIISFIIVAFAVFMVIRNINKMKKEEEVPPEEPTTKECGYCQMTIPIKATKFGHCTAELKATA